MRFSDFEIPYCEEAVKRLKNINSASEIQTSCCMNYTENTREKKNYVKLLQKTEN